LARIALIANPGSGGGTDTREIARALSDHGAAVAVTSVEDLDEEPPRPADRLVVASGDGSIAQVAALAARRGVPLAVVPAGTANDFARALDLPLDDLQAAARIAAVGTRTRWLDLGRFGPLPFLNVASAGLAVEAAENAEDLKDPLGSAAYALGAAQAGLTADPFDATVMVDDELLYEGEAWQVVVANTGHFGGGAQVPAEPDDGELDVVVLEAAGRPALVRRAFGLRTGSILEQDGVRHGQGQAVEVWGAAGFNVDGELRETSGPVELTVEAAAVEVVVG